MNNGITAYFEDVELYEEYDGYFCSLPDFITMFRKAAINLIKNFKNRNHSKTAVSNIMFECLMDPLMITRVIGEHGFPCPVSEPT